MLATRSRPGGGIVQRGGALSLSVGVSGLSHRSQGSLCYRRNTPEAWQRRRIASQLAPWKPEVGQRYWPRVHIRMLCCQSLRVGWVANTRRGVTGGT